MLAAEALESFQLAPQVSPSPARPGPVPGRPGPPEGLLPRFRHAEDEAAYALSQAGTNKRHAAGGFILL